MSYLTKNFFEIADRPTDGAVTELEQARPVVVADELTLLREGLAAIMEATQRYRVAGHCGDGEHALQLIQDVRPDVAILDFHLPGLFSLEIARSVRSAGIHTKIILMSKRCDRKSVSEALRSGVSAFLPKLAASKELVEALDRTLLGEVYVPASIQWEGAIPSEESEPSDAFQNLSPREFQVFSLMVEGVRAKEIAARLRLSPKTVDTYRSNLMRKLDIHDLPGLVKFAIERELTSRR
jgi:DNA-binding NarL/FixJ family response regulator